MRLLRAVVLGFLPYYVVAQTATCLSGFSWAFNSLGQSPCQIAATLGGLCVGTPLTLQPLTTTQFYSGPTQLQATTCRCSSVYYSVLSACAVCQDALVERWSAYNANCSTVSLTVFQDPLPSGFAVPHYAYLDPTANDGFNATLAAAAGGPDSTSIPQATGSLTSIFSPTSSAGGGGVGSGKKKSNAGAIAGGVVGGVVGLALVAVLVFWLLRRRQKPKPETPFYDNLMVSENPTGGGNSTVTYATTPAPKLYDPNDPSTFPTNSGSFAPTPYSVPSPEPLAQSQPIHSTPTFTGGIQPTAARPQYTGVAEVM